MLRESACKLTTSQIAPALSQQLTGDERERGLTVELRRMCRALGPLVAAGLAAVAEGPCTGAARQFVQSQSKSPKSVYHFQDALTAGDQRAGFVFGERRTVLSSRARGGRTLAVVHRPPQSLKILKILKNRNMG